MKRAAVIMILTISVYLVGIYMVFIMNHYSGNNELYVFIATAIHVLLIYLPAFWLWRSIFDKIIKKDL